MISTRGNHDPHKGSAEPYPPNEPGTAQAIRIYGALYPWPKEVKCRALKFPSIFPISDNIERSTQSHRVFRSWSIYWGLEKEMVAAQLDTALKLGNPRYCLSPMERGVQGTRI